MKTIEVSAKKVDKAIEEGLKQLGVSIAEAKIEVLEQGGLFRKAKVRLTLLDEKGNPFEEKSDKPVKADKKPEQKMQDKKPEQKKPEAKKQDKKPVEKNEPQKSEPKKPVEKSAPVDTRPAPLKPVAEKPAKEISAAQTKIATDYISRLVTLMGVEATVNADTSHGSIDIDIVTEDSAVIGHRGEVLDAMQLLAKRAAEEGDDKFVQVVVDSQGYRVRREQALVSLANRMAAKCVKTGRKVVLEPMNNTHRKIIHATLTDNDKVITRSEGHEPNRRVVILPKRNEKKQH